MNKAHALFAADAFYLAFANKDLAAMDALWATGSPVLCIHPGWPRLSGRDAIIESWSNILGNPNQAGPEPWDMQAHDWGGTIGVTCYERISGGVILATKLFVEEAGECRLVMHHGGPCNNPPEPSTESTTTTLLQ